MHDQFGNDGIVLENVLAFCVDRFYDPDVSPVAMNVRRAEWALRTALAEGTTSLRERAIALAAAPPTDDFTTG